MRWHSPPYRAGDTRVARRFLFLPLRLGEEYRWLESCYIYQRYVLYAMSDGGFWNDESFISDKDDEE